MFSSKSTLLINSICRARGCKGFANQAAKWDIVAAVCVERLPLVTPSINKHQKEFRDHLSIIELEKSCKSDHEIRHEADLAYLEKLKKSSVDQDLDGISNITAQDFEDASTDELSKFKPAPIQTEADKSNDQKSLERSLQSHLILLVEQQLGNKSVYILPQGKHNDGETLRQTAERVLKENCGDEIGAQFFGNAPTGYYKYKYPEEKNGATGAKIFFYYARHRSGQVKMDTPYKWLNRKELVTMLPSTYHSSLNSFLVEERE